MGKNILIKELKVNGYVNYMLLQDKNVLFLAKQECPVFMLLLIVVLFFGTNFSFYQQRTFIATLHDLEMF